MAMFGWLDIKQAVLCTSAAERKRLTREDINLLDREERPSLSHLEGRKAAGGQEAAEKPNELKDKFPAA